MNGETWITRTGGGGSIKLGEYDFGQAHLTVGGNGNVGIGTSSPTAKLTVHGIGGSAYNNGVEWYSGGNTSGYFGWVGRIYSGTPSGGWATAPFVFSVPDGSGNEVKTMTLLAGNVGVGSAAPGGRLTLATPGAYSGSTLRLETQSEPSLYSLDVGTTVTAGNVRWAFNQKNAGVTFPDVLVMHQGNVGIGIGSPTNKLEVNGTIRSKEVVVETTGWSDYVFADDYRLAPLTEVEAHIKSKKHLPGIPSAGDVATNGVSVGDMQARLLAKLEELTLHVIAQEKRINQQAVRIAQLEAENSKPRQK